jgi:hypothetical protein
MCCLRVVEVQGRHARSENMGQADAKAKRQRNKTRGVHHDGSACAPPAMRAKRAPDRVAAIGLLKAERHVRADIRIRPGDDGIICGIVYYGKGVKKF